jgi:hypothetical protein
VVMAEAVARFVVAAIAVAVLGSVAASGDEGTTVSAGCTARLAVGDRGGWGSLQRQKGRKAHVVGEAVVVVAAAPVDPGDIQGQTLFRLASWSIPTGFAHM